MTGQAVLVTGAAGFIGMHACQALVARGEQVLGIDNLNDYYSVALKRARLAQLETLAGFGFRELDIADREAVTALFAELRPRKVLHLAAQAGVRYSVEHPHAYADANLAGQLNILEGCRHNAVEHLCYASSSSVYGLNTSFPWSSTQDVGHPVSLYAASKRAGELMAHSYSHLYGLPCTGVRFFTVYGPWGRPDMAYWTFTEKILAGETIDVFNHGRMRRDFTYIDDCIAPLLALLDQPAKADPDWRRDDPAPDRSSAPFALYNIGGADPHELGAFIAAIEAACGVAAQRRELPMQPGDVEATAADMSATIAATGHTPQVALREGIERFVRWYRDYHHC